MIKEALIFWGGWDGHEPEQVAEHFRTLLEAKGLNVTFTNDMNLLDDEDFVKKMHVIVPVVTMSTITETQVNSISEAVAGGTGLVGCHGGMCDAFRDSVLWQFITGGNWVAHPGGDGIEHLVEFKNSSSPLVKGLKDFKVTSEHYYLHVDPAVEVLATTRFPNVQWYHSTNKAVDMPVVWSKHWGHGNVWYTSLGHHEDIVKMPEITELINRGLDFAIEGKDISLRENLTTEEFKSNIKMF